MDWVLYFEANQGGRERERQREKCAKTIPYNVDWILTKMILKLWCLKNVYSHSLLYHLVCIFVTAFSTACTGRCFEGERERKRGVLCAVRCWCVPACTVGLQLSYAVRDAVSWWSLVWCEGKKVGWRWGEILLWCEVWQSAMKWDDGAYKWGDISAFITSKNHSLAVQ